MEKPNVFSERGMDLSIAYFRDKMDYMTGRKVFGSPDLNTMTKEEQYDFFDGFMTQHRDVYPIAMGELNEILPTPVQFWHWYDSPNRIRNQLRREAEA